MKKVLNIVAFAIFGVFFCLHAVWAQNSFIDTGIIKGSSSLDKIQPPMMLMGAPGVPGLTYATWNPDDKSAHTILTESNLTYHNDAAGWHGVRSTICKSTGKWYWEQRFSGSSGLSHDGIGNLSASLTNYPGVDANSWAFRSADSSKCHSGIIAWGSDAPAWVDDDVLGIAIDLDNNKIDVYINGVQVMGESMFTNVIGTVCAFSGMASNGTTYMTANFGQTAFAYDPPEGYNYGLYEGTPTPGEATSSPQIGEIEQIVSGDTTTYNVPFILWLMLFLILVLLLEAFDLIFTKNGNSTNN